MSRFLEALHSGRVLLMDGAMGTELQRAGLRPGECCELWNLTHPERVQAIHQAYVDAGAEVLLTNTFQANPEALARHQLGDSLERIITQAVTRARSVAGPQAFVIADIGPSGDQRSPLGMESLGRFFAGADATLLETTSDVFDLVDVLKSRALIQREDVPLLLSMTFGRSEDGSLRTHSRQTPETCADRAREYPIAALGVNCGRDIGMDEIIEIVRRYRAVTDLPLFARPNAGTPMRQGERWIYPRTPAMLVARLPELLEAGVCMIGGCCGTTPEHIAAFRAVIDEWNTQSHP